MTVLSVKQSIPDEILQDSVLAHIAGAYFAVAKRLERKTKCSATRGFILSSLRGGASLNQNQIALRLGLDRTVVHRAIKTMVRERLVREKKARAGRALSIHLTAEGERYRQWLIKERRAADERVREALQPAERETLLRLLKIIAEIEF